jgi:quercetin dioxygenase-like cupin family protein
MTFIETVATNTPRPAVHKGPPASAGYFQLAREIDQLTGSPQYRSTGQAARTLVKRPDLRVVLIVLRRNADLKEHRTNQPVSIHVLKGRVRIALPRGCPEPVAGELLVLESAVTHDIMALTDSAFLLSMPWSEREP